VARTREADPIGWLKNRKRRKRASAPFPAPWKTILEQGVAHYRQLDEGEREKLHRFIQVFLPEKNWEGCGGLVLDDEIRVIITGQAGLLALGLPHEYYANVSSILVYPSTIVTPSRRPGTFEIPSRPLSTGIPILGEAQLRGPVILVWDSVKRNARHPEEGHNVVYHEFAHKLDMLDGVADGTPLLGNRKALARWVEVCQAEFLELRESARKGKRTYLDHYGATHEAEFFAVATEYFFDKPEEMEKYEAKLYALLRDFYHQDPAARERREPG
jgi:Mlc titration factor MtfA (ptsG expression regulator)